VVGDRGRDDEAARLDPDDLVDGAAAVVRDDGVDGVGEADMVGEQRRDVPEQDSGGRVVGDVADAVADELRHVEHAVRVAR
jgi:hypothetical protein